MNAISTDVTSYVVSLVVIVLGTLIGLLIRKIQPYVIDWLDVNTSKQVQDISTSVFRQAYSWAEKEFAGADGQIKYEQALQWGMDQLKSRGIVITLEQAKGFVQEAWQVMEGQLKQQVIVQVPVAATVQTDPLPVTNVDG